MEDEKASDAFSEDVQISVMDSVKIRADQRDRSSKIRADQRDGFSKFRADQRDGFSKIRADQDDGFSLNSRRKTCKRAGSAGLRPQQFPEKTGETKSTSPRNRFLAPTTIESDDDEQVNTVDSGAAKSVCPTRKKGVERPKSKEGGESGGGERKSHSS